MDNTQQKLNKWRDFACGEMERNNRMGAELATLRAKNERLREALREVTQTLSWRCFGECRGISDNLLEARDAVAIAKEALK